MHPVNVVTVPTQNKVVTVFAPVDILTNVTQVLQTDGYVAVRSPTNFRYRLNSTGPYADLLAGTILGINPRVTSVDFETAVPLLEVM